ncbi:hypothetical protein [Sinorhizobium fredii]|uniref:hypothetical protein n=1 Tax=Rhizobium fredii TaxID=380 RepID=UPI000314FD49|nr:hypothetical protein [Sinorhizobium fredii]
MADTKISALDDTNRKALRKKTLQPCGCLIGLSADLTTINASSGYFIPFNSESYDTDSIHDNVTNNTRMTVPSGWSWVRVGAKIYVNLISSGNLCSLAIRHFNSLGVEQSRRGTPVFGSDGGSATGEYGCQGSSCPIQVSTGDYFEVRFVCTDTSITILSNHTSAWMELLA